jgi:hypothetical protein
MYERKYSRAAMVFGLAKFRALMLNFLCLPQGNPDLRNDMGLPEFREPTDCEYRTTTKINRRILDVRESFR